MPADVAEIIASDHRQIEELFARLQRQEGDRRRLVDQVIGELSAHAAAKEQVVYPAVRDMVPGGGTMASKAVADSKAMRQALDKLDRGEPGEREFENTLSALMDQFRSHVPEEENELLPALRLVIGQDKMLELGGIFEQVKGTVPTR